MHEQLRAAVSKIARGQLLVVDKLQPGDGTITAIRETLPDFGMQSAEIEFFRAADMGDAETVELLNSIRLDDLVMVLSVERSHNHDDLKRFRYNVEQCFTRFGGRAVLVMNQ